MEIILLIIALPLLIGIFNLMRTKVDPKYKERMDHAMSIKKDMELRGYSDTLIDNEIRRQDLNPKHRQNQIVGNGKWALEIDKTLGRYRYDTHEEAIEAMENAIYIICIQVVKLDEFGTGRIIEYHEEKL